MKTRTTQDTSHTGHDIDHYETIYDNPVEVTTWLYCLDCDETFIGSGTEIVFEAHEEWMFDVV